MTNNSPKVSSTRRRRVLTGLLVIFVLAGSWVAYFLANFDLNDYREYLEVELSNLLSLPARIDSIHYNLHETNLALHVSGLQLGDEKSQLQINATDTMIDLQWRGLFVQEFRFIRITLTQPEIWVRRAAEASDSLTKPPAPLIMGQTILYNTSIGALDIVEGTVHIEAPDSGTAQEQILITGLQGELTEIHLNQLSRIVLEGKIQLPGQSIPSPWQLTGEASLNLDESEGVTADTDLVLDIQKLDLKALNAIFARKTEKIRVAGRCDLQLRLEGTLGEAVDFQASLSSDKIEILPGPGYTRPVSFRNLMASGQLLTDEKQHGIKNLSLKIDEALLAGEVEWAPPQLPFSAKFSLANSRLTVPQIKQWLPDIHGSWSTIKENLKNRGQVQLETLVFRINEGKDGRKIWHLDRLKGEVNAVAWQTAESPELEIRSLPFDLDKGRWKINDSLLHMGSLDISASGHGEYGQDSFTVASLDFTGEALPERLLSDWYIPQGALKTAGKAAVSGHLQGPYDQLSLDLQADLSRLYLNHPAGLKLAPDPQDKLSIHATLSPEQIKLDHGSIKWSAARGHISGSYLTGAPDSLALDALLTIDDLTRLAEALPLLDKLQLHGQADLSISQRGRREENRPTMTLTLRDAGLRATRHIADLKSDQWTHKRDAGWTGHGKPACPSRRIATYRQSRYLLTSPTLACRWMSRGRPYGQKTWFSTRIKPCCATSNGHLEIDRDGLLFAPVDVRLDGGTDASVNGTIDFTPPYPVMLDITSDFALISEVINLWSSQSKAKQIPGAQDQCSIRDQATDQRSESPPMSRREIFTA